jgi:hypothetical protein
MSEDKETKKEKYWKNKVKVYNNRGGLYGFGLIGAAIYYLQHATTFWLGVIGIIKAIFWPAVVIYKVFEILHL